MTVLIRTILLRKPKVINNQLWQRSPVFSADSPSKRCFTVDTVTLPESPGTVLLNERVDTLSNPVLAGALFALVRDCPAFNSSPEAASVVVAGDGVELQFGHKDLRLIFYCNAMEPVTWPTVRNDLTTLAAGTEWLVIVGGSLTDRARAYFEHTAACNEAHYIEIGRHLRWEAR